MKKTDTALTITKIVKWPLIGALIGGGVLAVTRLVGPSIADTLGERAGEGLARGLTAEARDKIAELRQKFISGWGTYR